MSPKSRRSKAKSRRITQQPAISTSTKATPMVSSPPPAQPVMIATTTSQYNHIINDLKLVGIIAGSMIIFIIILSFIL